MIFPNSFFRALHHKFCCATPIFQSQSLTAAFSHCVRNSEVPSIKEYCIVHGLGPGARTLIHGVVLRDRAREYERNKPYLIAARMSRDFVTILANAKEQAEAMSPVRKSSDALKLASTGKLTNEAQAENTTVIGPLVLPAVVPVVI